MKKKTRHGFSLIELLTVIAILALLAVLVLPGITSILRGNQLSRAGDDVLALLSLARQTSLAKNHPVEVRLYQFGDSETPGETTANPSSGKYRALQAFEIDDSGKATPIGRSALLPSGIIMDSGSTLSTLLAKLKDKSWTVSPDTRDLQINIPRVGTSYNCRAFRFLPDGSASSSNTPGLSKTDKWFVTLHNILDGDALTAAPANYITIQIDPANGSLKSWQP